MRVVHLIGSSALGGAERGLGYLLPWCGAAGVTAVVGWAADGPMGKAFRATSDQGRGAFPMAPSKAATTVAATARWMRALGCDVVHTHLWTADVIGLLAARRAGIRTRVSTVWGPYHLPVGATGVTRWRRVALSTLYRAIYRGFDGTIAISRAVAEDLEGRPGVRVPPGRVKVVPWGIDVDAVLREAAAPIETLPRGVPLIAMVANFHAVKGHATLLRAVPAIIERYRDATVVLVGDGPKRAQCESLARDLGLGDRVVFLGSRNDACAWMARSHVVVVPSFAEGLGLTMLEAMALGKPIVASAVGGPREVLGHGVTGILVPPGEPAALASAISQVAGAPAEAAEMGRRAREAVRERFDVRQTAQKVAAFYRQLIARPARMDRDE